MPMTGLPRRITTTLFAGGVLALALFSPAMAGSLDDGVGAELRGDYATAMRLLRPLAEQGNADAQFELGFMYQYGEGVPEDYEQAVAWYRKAADQGNAGGQACLGTMYRDGEACRRTMFARICGSTWQPLPHRITHVAFRLRIAPISKP
jgi:TPR repeat protein